MQAAQRKQTLKVVWAFARHPAVQQHCPLAYTLHMKDPCYHVWYKQAARRIADLRSYWAAVMSALAQNCSLTSHPDSHLHWYGISKAAECM